MTVELGDKVKDVVTGFEGVVIGITQWLTGCDTCSVQPGKISKDGKLSEATCFDRNRLVVVKKGVAKLPSAPTTRDNGGPVLNH